MGESSIAILIPCFNEAVTIGKVVDNFKKMMPHATIYVFDNNSTDGSGTLAAQHGAIVYEEKRQGKGFIVQSIFRHIDADIYLIVDGDDTYPADQAEKLLQPIATGKFDMSVGVRMPERRKKAYPRFHFFGNRLICGIINFLFKVNLQDVLSGYRCFSRQFAKSCPVLSEGFEVEAELTLQAIHKQFSICEIEIPYMERPDGSVSKLNTLKDGYIIITTIIRIFRDYKPLIFFIALAIICAIAGMLAGWVVVYEYIEIRYITHVPLAIFAVGSILLSFLLGGIGLVLDTLNRRFDELFNVFIRRNSVL